MSKIIKTKGVVSNIKAHDSSVSVSGRIKNTNIKTKDSVLENVVNETDTSSPQQYATDKIADVTRTANESAVAVGGEFVKKTISKTTNKVKQRIKNKETDKDVKQENPNVGQKDDDKANFQEKKMDKANNKRQLASPKTKEKTSVDYNNQSRQRQKILLKQKEKGAVKKVNENKDVHKLNSTNNKIKQTKRSAENTGRTIKTINNSVKNANLTVKSTTETARKTKQVAQVITKVTVKTVKVVSKAFVEAGKAIVAGVKSVGTIIAGGGAVIAVIIIICLIGAIGSTCFGIFIANDETTGTNKTMSQAISELTSEHCANLTTIKSSYTYDLLEMQGDTSINWKNVLAVYAVKTTSAENPLEVVTLDVKKIDLLRGIMKDMNTMKGVVTPKVVAETNVTTDEEGNSIKTTSYVTRQLLTISINQLNTEEIADLYNFNEEQKALLEELMSEEYDDLWSELIGVSGHIIQTNSSFVGTGIFAWPFERDQYISSPFGTRVDPLSGEIKTHGGTDIAAPLGTPILAAADGIVVTATWSSSYGYYVKIKHDDTYSTLYAHCSTLYVSLGETVKQGQVIADCGSTGYSTGPHLHYEVIQNGVRVNALIFYTNNENV